MSIPDLLRKNLKALQIRNADLAERLCWSMSGDHLIQTKDGKMAIQVHRTAVEIEVDPTTIEASLGDGTSWRTEPDVAGVGSSIAAASPMDILLFGMADGGWVKQAMQRWPSARVTVWDADPFLLRRALSTHDFAESLTNGMLSFGLSSDLFAIRQRHFDRIVPHPALARFYSREWDFLCGETGRPVAVICSGGLFVDDLAEALKERGFACFTLEVTRHSPEELGRTLRTLRPHMVFGINHTNGLWELCRSHGIALMCWEIDPAIDQPHRVEGPTENAHLFTFRAANVPAFRAAGFSNCHHLPLASRPKKRHPVDLTAAERAQYGKDVCFVGSSVTELVGRYRGVLQSDIGAFLEARGEQPDRASAVIDAILMEQRQNFFQYSIPRLAERYLPGLPAFVRQLGRAHDPHVLLGELAAAEKRLTILANLARAGARAQPKFEVCVWGDAGWRNIEKHGVRMMGLAGHHRELTRIYTAGRVHLDIGRIYQSDIVTMRVFDVLACGGALLTEHTDAVADLFEVGGELDTYRDVAELERKVSHYLANPDAARALGHRGMLRVRRDHTIAGRLGQMMTMAGLLNVD